VFPAPPGEKKSYKSAKFSNGVAWGATTDANQIKRDWRRWPDANPALPTDDDKFVVDSDTAAGHGHDGEASLAALEAQHGRLPPTLMAQTPSGGVHRYFRPPPGVKIKNSESELGPGIDIRGHGGMVLAPPAQKPGVGVYRWLNDLPIAAAPDWLVALCKQRDDDFDAQMQADADIGIDHGDPVKVSKVQAALAVIPSDNVKIWFRVGCILWNTFEDGGFSLFDDWSSTAPNYNQPPRMVAEQWEKCKDRPKLTIRSLYFYADKFDPTWRQRFKDQHGDDEDEDVGPAADANTAKPTLNWHGETKTIVARPALIKSLLPKTGTALIAGQWATGKTFLAIDLAACIVLKDIDHFIDYRIKRHGGVLFVAAEGAGSVELRFNAAIADKLKQPIAYCPPQPFAWIDLQPALLKHGAKGLIALANEAAAGMREKFNCDLVLIIIDTVAAAAAFKDENDAAEAQKVMNALGELSRQTNALVIGCDHFGKNSETGTRGSSAKEAYSETVLALVGDRAVTGKMGNLRLGLRKIRDGEAGRIVSFTLETVDCGKDEDGDPITTCVLRWEPGRDTSAKAGRPPKRRNVFREALTAAIAEHGETITPRGRTDTVRAARLFVVRQKFNDLYEGKADPANAWRKAFKDARETRTAATGDVGGISYVWEDDVF
jgi:hypothetical protein